MKLAASDTPRISETKIEGLGSVLFRIILLFTILCAAISAASYFAGWLLRH